MKKFINVPQGVEYLSNWAGFELPKGIFNKGVTGCGATTVAIEDGHKTVICCPRINLIKNKSRDGVMAVYGDVRTDAIKAYIEGTEIPKILVTYDGFPRVAELIEDRTDWRVVVDEYQYLLIDSGFKSEIEGKLLDTLKGFPYVTYLSATPIADKYMMEIDHFKSVPVTVLEWSDVERTVVKRVESNNPIDNALMIVRNYQAGNFTRIGDVESKECVIFLNSVENIVNIVKKTGLSPDDVNIIVGSSDDNKTLIKKLGEGFEVGAIPKEGEKHKMFTFCTSTAFAGCDFYSTCASTFVISDNRRQHTSIDIATELTQIAGRQRLAINPFRKTICFIYNTDIGTNDGYRVRLDEKLATSDRMAYFKNSISDKAVRRAEIKSIITLQRVERYKESYVMYNADSDRFDVNHWAYLNECFAYDVQHENYLNEYVVRAQLEDSGLAVDAEVQKSDYEEQLSCIITKEGFAEKMKRYCEYRHDKETARFFMPSLIMERQNDHLKIYYDTLGPERIKALGYKEKKLQNEIRALFKQKIIKEEFKRLFSSGTRMTTNEIKAKMAAVYKKHDIIKSAVASDLSNEYGLCCREVKIRMSDGTRKNGYEFL